MDQTGSGVTKGIDVLHLRQEVGILIHKWQITSTWQETIIFPGSSTIYQYRTEYTYMVTDTSWLVSVRWLCIDSVSQWCRQFVPQAVQWSRDFKYVKKTKRIKSRKTVFYCYLIKTDNQVNRDGRDRNSYWYRYVCITVPWLYLHYAYNTMLLLRSTHTRTRANKTRSIIIYLDWIEKITNTCRYVYSAFRARLRLLSVPGWSTDSNRHTHFNGLMTKLP